MKGARPIPRLAKLVATSCQARPRMCSLMSVVSSVLEQNLSADSVREFKTRALQDGMRLVIALHEAVPELSLEQHTELVRYSYALIAGLWPAANPPPVVREVLKDPALSALHHDFSGDLERGVRLVALGLSAES